MKNTLIVIGFIIVAIVLYLVWGSLNSKIVAIEADTGSYIYTEDVEDLEIETDHGIDLGALRAKMALLEATQTANTKAIDAILKRLEELKMQDCRGGNCVNKVLGRKTLFFGHDDSTLTPAAMAKIDGMLERTSANAFVSIRGHADTSGDNQYNHLLSLKRAAAVKRYIDEKLRADNKINNLLVSIDGTGEELVANATADNVDEASNRIVEILIFE